MIRINLLPHREESRKVRRQQFYTWLAMAVVAGGVIAFVGDALIGRQIEEQTSSNEFLKREIASLDKEIVEIKRLREQTQALLARKQVIESLQSFRSEPVQLFNEFAKQVPEGVFLKTIKQTGLTINVTGYAQSNARVSQLMRNLDASPVMEKPVLIEIKASTFNKRQVSEFNMNVNIERAQPAENEVSKVETGEKKP
jgi:type IV pilus assembly protein PilN